MKDIREGWFGPCERGEHEGCISAWVTTNELIRYVCTCPCHAEVESKSGDGQSVDQRSSEQEGS